MPATRQRVFLLGALIAVPLLSFFFVICFGTPLERNKSVSDNHVGSGSAVWPSFILPLRYQSHQLQSDHETAQDIQYPGANGHGMRSGIAALRAVRQGCRYLADVRIGKQYFELIVDTGSSDIAVLGKGVRCMRSGVPVDAANCSFGRMYDAEKTFKEIPGQHYWNSYKDGSFGQGRLGYDMVEIGGVVIQHQTIAIVNNTDYNGDSGSSGILGLGRDGLTRAFADSPNQRHSLITWKTYKSFITEMVSDPQLPHIFSLALDESGGSLAFGKTSAEHAPTDFVRAPLLGYDPRYTISLDHRTPFKFPGHERTENALIERYGSYMDDPNAALSATVDSGSAYIFVPHFIAETVAAQYQPPAVPVEGAYFYRVDCQAEPPPLAVRIAGRDFKIDPKYLILPSKGDVCEAAVMSNGDDFSAVVGQPFLKSVYAVFDLDAEEIRFAERR